VYKLIYSSQEAELFDDAALKRLLITSRMRNQAVGITGMLVYDHGVFLQALEGDASAVKATFERIERDARHRHVSVLFRDPSAPARSFGEWSMGFADASGASRILKGFLEIEGGLRHAVLDKSNAIKIMNSLSPAA
jgi:hypothetical protein